MNDVQATTDRILNTPLPLAYAIAISQLTWVYILILPSQLYDTLGLVAIPGTLFAAYIILGFAYIGQEIENSFGHDVNDLPLDDFCNQLAADIDTITTSSPTNGAQTFVQSAANCVLYPALRYGYDVWADSDVSVEEIRAALRRRALVRMEMVKPRLRRRRGREGTDGDGEGEGEGLGVGGRYEKVRATGVESV
ncbi:Uu.00g066190.m01.CDS01 [Anthostomella pinea]|uniref:Uu.00g066190.m01.CDS01 n=1 Tax=Anthostomella pinea TaxID=933095 RepID=A0AAI8VUP7_9PEZI|nr:Uu.00g066190.m01.CDS01 [Anthostomella pinea]